MTPTKEIRERLIQTWPSLEIKVLWKSFDLVLATDDLFYVPSIGEVLEFVHTSNAGQCEYVPRRRACEEFAFEMWVEAHKLIPKTGEDLNLAFGAGFAMKTKLTALMKDPRHYLCVAVTQDGIYMIDPRSKQVWSPTDEDSFVWIVL